MSDHNGVLLDMAVRISPPPPLPLRFNMRQADWGRFTAITEALLAETPDDLPLAMRASLFTDSIMEAARQAIPLAKPHTRIYRDAKHCRIYSEESTRQVDITVTGPLPEYRHKWAGDFL
ncbi:hypothetical protein E2C01_070068 [Portunus trituberculatus]|uniref:Uncharacterized protein n=1 Tax=Portunus trituberculatus TaxID=210409 RepID=A0A5B7I0K7_PORTR|nr:hypothetical protein [Portunus trituberculatus]